VDPKKPNNQKKYRDPIPGTKEAERVEMFRRAGINLRIEDTEPREHRLMFFGPVPDSSAGESEE
jgi:hypothetical protein